MKSFSLLVLAILSSFAWAQEMKPLESCKSQIQLFCSDVKRDDTREIVKCLMNHRDELSESCKDEIQRFVKILRQTTPPGGGPLGMLGGMTSLAAQVPMFAYDGNLSPAGKEGQKSPSIIENNLRFSMPILASGEDKISLSLNAGRLSTGEAISLDSGIKIPQDLYRTSLGLQYSHRLPNKKMYGVQGSFGYTGDEFNENTQSYNLNANYSYPGSKEGHWVLMVLFSNNSPLGNGVPIPGFFYIHKTENFTGVFGLPIMSIQWTPVDSLSLSLSALGPMIKSEVSYGTIDETQVFTGVSWNQQRYLLSSRENERDRLTLEDKKIEAGFRKPITTKTFAEFKLGHSFDRAVYIGEGLFNRDTGEASLKSSSFFSWSLRYMF